MLFAQVVQFELDPFPQGPALFLEGAKARQGVKDEGEVGGERVSVRGGQLCDGDAEDSALLHQKFGRLEPRNLYNMQC